MKVGFLCGEYPTVVPDHGGIGSAVQTLARSLIESSHEVEIFSLGEQDGEFADGAVRGTMIAREGTLASTLRMRRLLQQRLKSGAIDTIESPETEAHMLPRGPGSVVRINGSHHFWCEHLTQKRRPVRLALEQIGLRSAQGLCAVSRFAAEETRRVMHLGNRPIAVLPNPIDTELFRPQPDTVVPGRVVFAGTLTPKKGVRELCLAVDKLADRFADLHLILLGRDSEDADGQPFRERVFGKLSPEAKRRTEFKGPVHREEVASWMRSAQLCAFPSYMETQGIVVGEALASGRPAIASRLGPGPETLGEPPAGWLVDPRSVESIASAIAEALEDQELCHQKGAAGREFITHQYGKAALLEDTVAFYEQHRASS